MNLIFRTVRLQNFITSVGIGFFLALTRYYKQYHQVHFLVILFGKMSSSESFSSSGAGSETERMTEFKKFGLQPYSLELTKSRFQLVMAGILWVIFPPAVMQQQIMWMVE